jgi:hypothetical protein
MAYDSTALRQSLARLGVNPEGVVEGVEPVRRIRVMDVLMLEREALLRAYLGGASVSAIFKICKEHGLVACSAPTFFSSFNAFLGLAQVPRRSRAQTINAKRRLILKPGVAKLMVEMRPLFARQPDENPASPPSSARRRTPSPRPSVSPSEPVVTVASAPGRTVPRSLVSGAVLGARGPLDLHRDNLRKNG